MTDKGFVYKAKGKVKETAGDITNDKELKAEGLLDQAKGKIKEVATDAKDITEEIKEKIDEKIHKNPK